MIKKLLLLSVILVGCNQTPTVSIKTEYSPWTQREDGKWERTLYRIRCTNQNCEIIDEIKQVLDTDEGMLEGDLINLNSKK